MNSPMFGARSLNFRRVLTLFALTALALPCGGADAAPEITRTIRVATDNAYAPYSFLSDQGEVQGMVVDQWRAWEKHTGIKVEISALDWGEALRRTRAGEFDVIDCIVETPDRTAYFDFTEPYASIEAAIFFRDDISGIAGIPSLKGFPVGVKVGDQHVDRLAEVGVTTLIPFPGNDAIIEAAKERKINVFVADVPSAAFLLAKAGIDAQFRHSPPIFRDELRRAVRKGDAALLRTVSDGFAGIDARELARIQEKWSGRSVAPYAPYLVTVAYAAALASLFLVGLAAWNRALRHRVLQRTAALSESEQRFRRLVDLMPVAVYVCDASGIVQTYNQRAVELWGRTPRPGDLAQRYCGSLRLYSPDGTLVPHQDSLMAEALRTGTEASDQEVLIERPDGTRISVVVNIAPLLNGGGKVIGAINCFQDITERKRAEQTSLRLAREMQALSQQKEDHLRLVIDTIPAMAWSLLADGTLEFVNRPWLEYTGLSRQRAVEDPTYILHPDDLAWVLARWQVDRPAGAASAYEMRLRRGDGEYRWFLVRTVPLRDDQGNIVRWYGTSTDIEDLKRARDQLQALSRRLVELQETERKELSRELHDRIGQNLTALGINLEILRTQSEGNQFDLFRSRLQDSATLVASTADAIENLMSELRPPMLDDYGLLPALGWYAKQFTERTGISVLVRGDEHAERATLQAESALFRIAQEALNNVAKHSHATQVEIEIEQAEGEHSLSIADNGTGFALASDSTERPPQGLGMATMRERTQAVGGRFELETAPGSGTRVIVVVPVERP